ncbi:MAG: AAA family ATPase [Bacteroidetes bacterium]|nr:AAA family ATPase [Bacteroidota bacterium]
MKNQWSLLKPSTKMNGVFDTNYLEIKAFYLQKLRTVPCISFVNNVDAKKAFDYLYYGLAAKVKAIYQRNYYEWEDGKQKFTVTVFHLRGKIMVEIGHDYAEILFPPNNYQFANDLMKIFAGYKAPAKEEDYEINIISRGSNGLDLKALAVKPTHLDVNLYYNDDFKPIDEIIRKRLATENDKGIILLHGLPGTGKTTYLRHLIGIQKKKVLFVAPGVAGNIMDPEFIDLLIDNPNSIVVIEDAENIITDRKYNQNSSVSNLLNISDGLLSDCLNVQIICTFNSSLTMVDSALMRKGRLIAKYEFGKLTKEKAQQLSNHLGLHQLIEKPMTIAEIANSNEPDMLPPKVEVLGFRREVVMN